ncbi:SDR family NAD(P)-dependent oxidoreductase [Niveispirillum cyanobacteriorum]|uniref:SDR family oxidoreductase n=1 Tax=Niveispirillum cyanobacteriorum TaxID=1612173 RepID=A0A2K9NKC8_9PROT|nr:SDR family oxidoreductase [Niveispirillum cyanobacteriorum]AUN32805.1 SDR family oxidoreductase [Niveispirillum cyanobacteriorum]GGE88716.1 SDR family oxidoreductase [Niveispirillum cyanobacteriorum]
MSTQNSKGTALVTGASAGIGATYAERLARRGYDLILVARDAARLEALALRLRTQTGRTVDVLPADLGSAAGQDIVANRLVSDGAITLIVNNAGLGPNGPALSSAPTAYDAMLALNVAAVQRLTLTAAHVFAAKGAGTIINIASAVALLPERFNGPYVATKAFVLALTQALAAELSGKGVTFQAVLPGYTRTEIFERAGIDPSVLPQDMVMEVGDLVDAALSGLDQGELVTIPSLPDSADWQALEAARMKIAGNASRNKPAARFGVA